MPSRKPLKAITGIIEYKVFAHFSAFIARITQAVINVCLTVSALEAGLSTVTDVIVHQINAFASILTGVECALIHIDLTFFSFKAGLTLTLKSADLVNTSAVIETGSRLTLVDVSLTNVALEAEGTLTGKVSDSIMTEPSVLTRIGKTFINLFVTSLAFKSLRTIAKISSDHILTNAPILTRIGSALIDV